MQVRGSWFKLVRQQNKRGFHLIVSERHFGMLYFEVGGSVSLILVLSQAHYSANLPG